MASKGDSTLPPLLVPLTGDCTVVEDGGNAAESAKVLLAIREVLLESEAGQSGAGGRAALRVTRIRPGRMIFKVRTIEGEYVVKVCEAGFMAKMSPLRFCATGREWKSIQEALARGLPTSRAVALVSARGKPAVNCLIIEKLKGAVDLAHWLDRERERLLRDSRLRRRFTEALAKLVATLHQAGLLHHDLHLRNIMIRPPKGGESFVFYVIDLGGEEFLATTPTRDARYQNLAHFSLCFIEWPRTARRRFLRAYRLEMQDSGDERLAVRDIEEIAQQRQFDLNTVRIATCTDASSGIARVERDGSLMLIYRRAPNADLDQLERPLGRVDPDRWNEVLEDHFRLRFGEAAVWKLKSPIEKGDEQGSRRKVEALWGRLLELNAIQVKVPALLACVVRPPHLTVYARVPGKLTGVGSHKDDGAYRLFEEMGRQLVRLHTYGCFFLPLEPEKLLGGLAVATSRWGGRELVFCAPDHIFRGSPTTLGQQAVASLGRVARTVAKAVGDRQMKELVWCYGRVLRLNHYDFDALFDEVARVPTGRTIVMTRGIERSRLDRGAR